MTGVRLSIGLIISVVCFYLTLQSIDLSHLKYNFENIDIVKVLYANVALMACQWIRSQRWMRLLKHLCPIQYHKIFEIYSVGNLANLLIPLRGGDLLRAWVAANHFNIAKSTVLATVIAERLSDLVFFGLLLGVSVCLYPLPIWIIKAGGLLFLGSIVIFSIIVLLKAKGLFFLSPKIAERFDHIMKTFFSGIVPLPSFREYSWFVLETFLTWGLQGVFIYILFDAFNLTTSHGLGLSAALLMLALTTVAITIPSSPSYAGTLHLMIVLSLDICGVPEAKAFSYAVMFHALLTIDTLFLGLYGLVKMHLKFGTLFTQKLSFKN